NRRREITLNRAFQAARSKRHGFMTAEHRGHALLANQAAVAVLRACGADPPGLRRVLPEFSESATPRAPSPDSERESQPPRGSPRVVQRAVFHVQSCGKSEVNGANVLAAIVSEQESQAVFFLKQQHIARIDVVNFISPGISKVADDSESVQM